MKILFQTKNGWGKKIAFLVIAFCTLSIVGGVLFSAPQATFAWHTVIPPPDDGTTVLADCPNDPVTGQPDCGNRPTPIEFDCGWDLDPTCAIAKMFYNIIYLTLGTLVWIAGSFLDLVIKLTVLDFHTWAGMPAVRIIWTLLRDTITMGFIFFLLYAAISMILGLGKEKDIVKKVILAGLCINFSFFYTAAIIDFSNTVTIQMYQAVEKIGDNISASVGGGRIDGIAAVFVNGTGIQFGDLGEVDPKNFIPVILQQMIFSSITYLVLAFIFLATGLLILGSFIVKLLLLLTSAASIMGGTYGKKWWKNLIEQAMFMPILMLFFVVTAVLVNNADFRKGFSNLDPNGIQIQGLAGQVTGLMQYAVVIGLLIIGIIVAKQGAGLASNKASDWAVKKAQAAPGAVSGFLGRKTIGRASNAIGKEYNADMGRFAVSDNKFKRFIASAALHTGVDEGIRDTFKAGAESRYGGQVSFTEREKQLAQRKKERVQAVREENQVFREKDNAQTIKTGLDQTERELANGTYNSTQEDIEKYLKVVAKITDKEIEEMLATGDIEKLKRLAPDLSAGHMKKIMESDLITADKDVIVERRSAGMLNRLNSAKVKDGFVGVSREAKRIASGKSHEVAKLPPKVLKNAEVASRLSIGALSKIADEVSDTDRSEIKANIMSEETRLGKLLLRTQAQDDQLANIQKIKQWFTTDAGQAF